MAAATSLLPVRYNLGSTAPKPYKNPSKSPKSITKTSIFNGFVSPSHRSYQVTGCSSAPPSADAAHRCCKRRRSPSTGPAPPCASPPAPKSFMKPSLKGENRPFLRRFPQEIPENAHAKPPKRARTTSPSPPAAAAPSGTCAVWCSSATGSAPARPALDSVESFGRDPGSSRSWT